MKEGLLLTVIATVVAVDGGQARLDRGLLDGLLVGDRGEVFYRLKVGDTEHDIVQGEVAVGKLGKAESWAEFSSTMQVRPGYAVRFEVPGDRISPRALLAAARELAADDEGFRDLVEEVLTAALDTDDPEVLSLIRGLLEQAPPAPEPALESPPTADMVLVAGGTHRVGADLGEARFFNEHPRFSRRLESFWVDRQAVSPVQLGRPTFGEALAYCVERGKRLPTEAEWEVAVQLPKVERGSRLEWTDSWYQPYPGNPMKEPEYGRRFKVVRGGSGGEEFSPHRRRFMAPDRGHADVGFRCVREAAPAGKR